MKAIWRGRVIAESDRTIEVDGYHYFPRESVQMELFSPAPKSDEDLVCPHGVQFYNLTPEGDRSAWSYEAPRASMKNVDHWIGFWREVKVL